MKQEEYFGFGSIEHLGDILAKNNAKNIFLVTGKDSYDSCGARDTISQLEPRYTFSRFCDFSDNPKLEDVEKGMRFFHENLYDMVVAIGGGSVIDMAKLISILSVQTGEPLEYITGEKELKNKGRSLVAIPTTAGSGSEATHFAVVYTDGRKYSVANDGLLPEYVILDQQLTVKLLAKITASTGMDALSQSIESYWSVNSTEESKEYSKESIRLILNSLELAVKEPTEKSRADMMRASNLAGKAINITKTTAPHALSYALTSYFGVPHGHAAALTLGEMLVYNNHVKDSDVVDLRGASYVKRTILELNYLFGTTDSDASKRKIKDLMESIGLETHLSHLGIKSERDIELIVNSVNTERLGNNPRILTKSDIKKILYDLL